jgi:hypothetical protein
MEAAMNSNLRECLPVSLVAAAFLIAWLISIYVGQ